MDGFLDFLLIVLGIPLCLVVIVGALSIYVMNREKRDAAFGERMDRYRSRFTWTLSRRAQKIIVGVIVLGLLVYYAYTGQIDYNPDEFRP